MQSLHTLEDMSLEKLRDEDLKLAELLGQARAQALEYGHRIADLQRLIEQAEQLVHARNQTLLTGRNPLLEGTTAQEEDGLTGLPQRAALERALERIYSTGEVFSVVTFEVDQLGELQQQFGTEVAEEVLRRVAGLLRKVLRASDVAGRLGQAEFALILRGINSDRAYGVCERLRVAVFKYPWNNLQPGLKVTISLGFAAHDGNDKIHDVLARADRYQAEARSSGRNQTFPGIYY